MIFRTIIDMKIAILSDIHGNLPALQATISHLERWQPDQVVVAGDIVNRGPNSLACWALVEEKSLLENWYLIRGNHEEYVINWSHKLLHDDDPHKELAKVSGWTYHQLNGEVASLAALPEGCSLHVANGEELRVRHASMHHNRDGLYPEGDDETIYAQISPAPALFATAHTHLPFVRQVNGTLVVNSGSVGTPADGDGRASYAQVTYSQGKWQAAIQRVDYDVEQARQDYYDMGILAQAGPMAWLVFYEWQFAVYLFPQWMKTYWPQVLAGDLEAETAVVTALEQMGVPVPIERN